MDGSGWKHDPDTFRLKQKDGFEQRQQSGVEAGEAMFAQLFLSLFPVKGELADGVEFAFFAEIFNQVVDLPAPVLDMVWKRPSIPKMVLAVS